MADPYLEKPKPSRSMPLFDSRDHVARIRCRIWCRTRSQRDCLPRIIRNASETAGSSSADQPDAYLSCYITATNSARQALQIRSFSGQRGPLFCGSPELRSAPLNSMLTLAVESPAISYIELDGIASYSFTASINETARVRSLRCRP